MTRESDMAAGKHLVNTLHLTFSVVESPEIATDIAISVVRSVLSHVERPDRARVGAALVAAALAERR